MTNIDRTGWEILNATADDWENLEQIYRVIPREVASLEDIADRIPPLVEGGLLTARQGSSQAPLNLGDHRYVWHAWFAMSPRGRVVWESNVPADLVG